MLAEGRSRAVRVLFPQSAANKIGDCSVLLRINIIADITKGRRVMRRKRSGKGSCVIAFGLGLFLAYCFPSKFIIVSLAVLLVISGLLLLRTDF